MQSAALLQTLFEPGDLTLFRLIETYVEGGRKRSRIDHHGDTYRRIGSRPHGVWMRMPNEFLTPSLRRLAARAAAQYAGCHFGVCPRVGIDHYNNAWSIRTVRSLWTDIDDCTTDEALERCGQAELPQPTAVVNSGNGTHLYWRLDSPILIDDADDPPRVLTEWIESGDGGKSRKYVVAPENGEKLYLDSPQNVPELSAKAQHVQDILAGIASKIGGDHATDLARLLRLPGTWNRKNQRNGQTPVKCELIDCEPHRRYGVEAFEGLAEESPSKKERSEIASIKLPTRRRKLYHKQQDTFNELVSACKIAKLGERSEVDFALAVWCVEHGMSADDVWTEVRHVGKFKDNERYFQRTWRAAERRTRTKTYSRVKRRVNRSPERPREISKAPSEPEQAFGVIVADTNEEAVVNKAIARLATAENIYQRGGLLVQVVRNAPPPRGIDRPEDAPRIAPLRLARLREVLATVAVWMQPGREDLMPVHPPEWAVKAVDARGEWPGIRRIEGVVEAPVLRADGTVLHAPGYDEATGLYYQPQIAFPEIPATPTHDDAKNALKKLLEVVEDFPFAKDEHRAAWVASVLTPLSRFAYHGPAPLFLIDANVRGSGKSLLADVTALIASGRRMARMSAPHDDDEFRKRITALAIAGAALSSASLLQSETHFLQQMGMSDDMACKMEIGLGVGAAVCTGGAGTLAEAEGTLEAAQQGLVITSGAATAAEGASTIQVGRLESDARKAEADALEARLEDERLRRAFDQICGCGVTFALQVFTNDDSKIRSAETLRGLKHGAQGGRPRQPITPDLRQRVFHYRQTMSERDIAKMTGLPKTTVHRILANA